MRISDWSSDVCSSDLIGRTEATTTTVFWFTILSLPPLAIGMFFFGQAHDALTWGLLAIIGLAGGMGQLCLTGALRWAPVSVVLPMDYSSLIWATLFGWLRSEEHPSELKSLMRIFYAVFC